MIICTHNKRRINSVVKFIECCVFSGLCALLCFVFPVPTQDPPLLRTFCYRTSNLLKVPRHIKTIDDPLYSLFSERPRYLTN